RRQRHRHRRLHPDLRPGRAPRVRRVRAAGGRLTDGTGPVRTPAPGGPPGRPARTVPPERGRPEAVKPVAATCRGTACPDAAGTGVSIQTYAPAGRPEYGAFELPEDA